MDSTDRGSSSKRSSFHEDTEHQDSRGVSARIAFAATDSPVVSSLFVSLPYPPH